MIGHTENIAVTLKILKTTTLTEPAICFYWLITLLPYSMLNLLRKIKR